MRRKLSLICCLLLTLSLLAGCSDKETEPTTLPTRAELPKATAPTEEIPETTAVPTEAQLHTVALRDKDAALRKNYVLLAISSEAPFLAQGVKLNETGADALAQWIMGKESHSIIENLGKDEFGEAIFTMPTDTLQYAGKISKATEKTKTIHLAVESSIAESGLTDELLPVFEDAYGYQITLSEGSTVSVLNSARSGYVDLILLEYGEQTEALVADGFVRAVPGLQGEQLRICAMQYLLCGPEEDPAGIANCASVGESFAAIAKGEFPFTSRGKDSSTYLLEQKFWPTNQHFGDWYLSADMEMGPCLVMNDMEGGYILTDKLTWLIYATANGII